MKNLSCEIYDIIASGQYNKKYIRYFYNEWEEDFLILIMKQNFSEYRIYKDGYEYVFPINCIISHFTIFPDEIK